ARRGRSPAENWAARSAADPAVERPPEANPYPRGATSARLTRDQLSRLTFGTVRRKLRRSPFGTASPRGDIGDRFEGVTILLAWILAPLILMPRCFAVELLVGLASVKPLSFEQRRSPDAVIIVPAHDEEAIIGSTFVDLQAAAAGIARILVI